jgi:hypothetical protein
MKYYKSIFNMLILVALIPTVGCSSNSMIDQVKRENASESNKTSEAQNKCIDFYRSAVRFYPGFGISDGRFTAITKNGEVAAINVVPNDKGGIMRCGFSDYISPKISKIGEEVYEKGSCGAIESGRLWVYQLKETGGKLEIYAKSLNPPLCISYGKPLLLRTFDQITKKSNLEDYQLTILK